MSEEPRDEALIKVIRDVCDDMVASPSDNFNCTYPDCMCGPDDKAVIEGKRRMGRP